MCVPVKIKDVFWIKPNPPRGNVQTCIQVCTTGSCSGFELNALAQDKESVSPNELQHLLEALQE